MMLADRLSQIAPSATMAMSARAKALREEGRDVIDLTVGEPDFNTPEHIKEATCQALADNHTRYTPVDGIPALKAALAQYYQERNLHFASNQIIVSTGAKQALFNAMLAYLNPGDEVIIPTPYWVSYPDMVKLAGGVAQCLSLQDLTSLEKALPKARAIVLNSPNNPSGQVYSQTVLSQLANLLKAHPEVLIISDDIYEQLYWGEGEVPHLLLIAPELQERTLLVNGVSKAYCMTGFRIGFAAGPAPLIGAMKTLQSQSTSNPCSIAQYAALAALTGPQAHIQDMVETFKARHDRLINLLSPLRGCKVTATQGAFYLLIDCQGAIESLGFADDIAFAQALLEANVATVPGSPFGAPNHIRISFATDWDSLEKAVHRFAAFLEK